MIPETDQPDYENYVMNCAIKFIAEILWSVDDPRGGFVAEIMVGDRGP